MRQIRLIASAVLMSGVIVLGFQNCGQPGQLTAPNIDSGSISNSLEIAPPSSGNIPVSSSGSALVQVDPSANTVNDTSQDAICRDMSASDILLNVDQVESNGPNLRITEVDHSISIAKATMNIEAVTSGKISEVRIVLNPVGNLVLGSDNVAHDLTTPSGQTSGFKVHLAQETQVEAGHKYELELNIDLSQQIVRAGKKCLLKPEIKNASLKQI